MDKVEVLAVVGSCASERAVYAKRVAAMTQRTLVPATRLAVSLDPVDEALSIAPWVDEPAGALMEFPTTTPMTEVIGALAEESAPTVLVGVVCVVDAAHLIDDLWRDTYRARVVGGGLGRPATENVAEALATANQIEFASHIVLVNWSTLHTQELPMVMAVVSHLAPRARLRLQRRIVLILRSLSWLVPCGVHTGSGCARMDRSDQRALRSAYDRPARSGLSV